MKRRLIIAALCLLALAGDAQRIATAAATSRHYSTTGVTLNVCGNGHDDVNAADGSESQPFATAEFTLQVFRSYYDAPTQLVKICDGASTQSLKCMGPPVGAPAFGIIGNHLHQEDVLLTGTIELRDGCILTLDGLTAQCAPDGSQIILTGQLSVLDVQNTTIGECPNGVAVQVDPSSVINITKSSDGLGGGIIIAGNAIDWVQLNGGTVSFAQGMTVHVPHALGFDHFAYVTSGQLLMHGALFDGPGATSVSGDQYLVTCGTIVMDGSFLPGKTHGTALPCEGIQ